MAEPTYEPESIELAEDGLRVRWKDGHQSVLPHRMLRGNCGCAQCVDEMSHVRHVREKDVPEDVAVADYLEVGRYALNLLFTDLHQTGIYPYRQLRALCPCEACRISRQDGQDSQDKG